MYYLLNSIVYYYMQYKAKH